MNEAGVRPHSRAAGVRAKRWLGDQRSILLIILAAICLATGLINPKFFRINNIISILQQVSVLGMITMGMVLLLLCGMSDLSVGMNMTLCGICISRVILAGGPVWLAILTGVATGALCGLFNGVVIAKTKCMPLIITIGSSSIFSGLALVVSQGKFMNFQGKFNFISRTRLFGVLPMTLVFLFVTVLMMLFLVRKTRFGRRVVSVGSNEAAAYLAGVHVDFYKIMSYVIVGVICGVASVVFVSRLDSIVADAGGSYSLSALSAAVIGGVTFEGGRGTVTGALIGVLFMGVISNVMTVLNVNNYWQTAINGFVIVAAVIISNISKMKRA